MTFVLGVIILAVTGVAIAWRLGVAREKLEAEQQTLKFRLQEAKRAEMVAALVRKVRPQNELGTLRCHVSRAYSREFKR